MEGPYLAIHTLQPLEPQVCDNSRSAVIHWEDVYSELLRRCCDNLGGGVKGRGGGGEPKNLIIHRHLNCQVWNPEISWHFRVGAKPVSTTCQPLVWDLGRILPAKGHYTKESEKPGAQGGDFTCHGSWRLHTSACSKFNVTLRWNNKQNIFLSITLVKSFLRGRRKPSLKC